MAWSKQTAGVVTHVEDELLHPLATQRFERLRQLLRGRVREAAGQADVADAGADHEGVADRGLRDARALDGEVERRLAPGALDLDGDGLAFGAAHGLRDGQRRPLARVLAVDLDDAVAEAQAGLGGGRALDGRLDVDAVAVAEDGDADACEARLLVLQEPSVLGGREEVRVRVEREEHALHGRLVGLLVVHGVDVVLRDDLERLVIGALHARRVALGAAGLLREGAPAVDAADERGGHDDDRGRDASERPAAHIETPELPSSSARLYARGGFYHQSVDSRQ